MDFLLNIRTLLSRRYHTGEQLVEEKRSSPRMLLEFDAHCRRGEEDPIRARITDLGLYGLKLKTPIAFHKDEVLELAPVREQEILDGIRYSVGTIKVTVIWSRRGGKGGETVVGLKYTDTRSRLQNSWVAALMQKVGFSVGYRGQKRKSVRVPIQLPVFYRTPRGEDSRGGTTIDLGMGGVLILAPSGLPQESEVRMIVGPLGNLAALCCRGRIIHHEFSKKRGCWFAGIAFIKMTEAQNRLLTKYIETLLKEQRRG